MTKVCFHEPVVLFGWSESSSAGCKVSFKLQSRESLEHFDKATRRRRGRAGQRYHAALSTIDAEPQPIALDEFWFMGANWAHQDGARVSFSVVSLEPYHDLETSDQKAGKPLECWLTLIEIGDDERPVDQDKADLLEQDAARATVLVSGEIDTKPMVAEAVAAVDAAAAAELAKPKGGPHSKNVAMLCQDDEFRWWIAEQIDAPEKPSEEQADAWVKQVVGIQSKVELDHDPEALKRFQANVQRPFLRWLNG